MLTLGETAILLVLIPPDQVYVFAPLAVKIIFSPTHIVVAVEAILIIGTGLTKIESIADNPTQPLISVPTAE